ncbi:uncharacterized protein YALI1_D33763g [Yarrowia lipolytica]|uniref:Secreted protein n=1 Tax=Yarrowia lipolytica TaxID=4952 RepID=A0A1D8NG72_YARLL|nr:hypothetical protein YALI1_D33763g [Yarrowia lipolytica]
MYYIPIAKFRKIMILCMCSVHKVIAASAASISPRRLHVYHLVPHLALIRCTASTSARYSISSSSHGYSSILR